jgi:hypothetical protein
VSVPVLVEIEYAGWGRQCSIEDGEVDLQRGEEGGSGRCDAEQEQQVMVGGGGGADVGDGRFWNDEICFGIQLGGQVESDGGGLQRRSGGRR